MKSLSPAGVFCCLLLSLNAMPAHAYLDPGSGSLIIQGIIGALAAFGITAKLYWHKIRLIFGGHKTAEPESDAGESQSKPE